MRVDRYSFFVIILLNLTIKSAIAITGCIVTLISPTSVRRKVLCANPKGPIENIPEGLPPTTDMLIISNQSITSVKEQDFDIISRMTSLFLTFSNLEKIHKNSFQNLTHLMVLDLSGNRLTISDGSLPAEIFTNLSELRHLRLSSNPLTVIPDFFFRPMSMNLRKLYLNKCGTPPLDISPAAFNGLNNIEELDIRDNGLVGLLQPMEADLKEMKLLKQFLISGNSFFCDCKLRWLYFYLTQIQEAVTIVLDGDKDCRCSGPNKLLNKHFPVKDERDQLRYIDFVCSPKCSITGHREFIFEAGSVVNLTCDCFSDPIQRLTWSKNGHDVEEMANKYMIFHAGKETFQSTLNILSLQPVDSGNWTCKLDSDVFQNFSLKIKSSNVFPAFASINVYILVGLGSSLLLISLVVIVIVIFCRREVLCQFRHHHPMVICGYETNIRKPSMVDGDIQYRYNQQDGRFNTSFYENTIPFDSSLSHYRGSNHLFSEDDKDYVTKPIDFKSSFPKSSNEKMLNMYCGCHYNSDDEPDVEMMRSSYSNRSRSLKPLRENISQNVKEEKFQQLKLKTATEIEHLLPNIRQCSFHGSSGTLTRIPGQKPCPVHGSTATLPSRLSSKKVEHRFGCPKHNRDNMSVKSLKLDDPTEDRVKPHRCKSANKLSTKIDPDQDKVEIVTPIGYKPCPLHGDILAAISENIFEPSSNNAGVQSNHSLSKRIHSKALKEHSLKIPTIGCDKSGKKPMEAQINRSDHFQATSVGISPVPSSLSSSPLLTSDVHGTLV